MSVTCYYAGRFGNAVLHAAHLISYAKKYDLEYFIPVVADAYKGFTGNNKVPFVIPSTGSRPINPKIYNEPDHVNGNPRFHEIPKMDNVMFLGYYQSFLYFSWCRDYILETFNFPYKMENGITSISVRRGDCIGVSAFPICPLEYYQNAVNHMKEKGFNRFKIHSDDLEWCKQHFTKENFPDAEMNFYEGHSEMENYLSLQNCENNITARSTFSLTAAWMNQNPNKTVLVPTTKFHWWRSMNLDLLTGTNFTQIDFEKIADE